MISLKKGMHTVLSCDLPVSRLPVGQRESQPARPGSQAALDGLRLWPHRDVEAGPWQCAEVPAADIAMGLAPGREMDTD
jgi:hypothetical protein